MRTSHLGLWYLKSNTCSLIGYLNMDLANSKTDRKSTTGGCQFIGHSLISWQCKKQNSVILSTTMVQYIATKSSWLKIHLKRYDPIWDKECLLTFVYCHSKTNNQRKLSTL